jgi:hypothetical protein
MAIILENIEQVLSGLVYESIEGIEDRSLTFDCELIRDGYTKLDRCFIYRGAEEDSIIPIFGNFNCRYKSMQGETVFIKNVKGGFNVDYNNLTKELVDGTFECSLNKR